MSALRRFIGDPRPRHYPRPDRVSPPCFCRVSGYCVTCALWARRINSIRAWRKVFRGGLHA